MIYLFDDGREINDLTTNDKHRKDVKLKFITLATRMKRSCPTHLLAILSINNHFGDSIIALKDFSTHQLLLSVFFRHATKCFTLIESKEYHSNRNKPLTL